MKARMYRKLIWVYGVALLLLILTGCGNGQQTQSISMVVSKCGIPLQVVTGKNEELYVVGGLGSAEKFCNVGDPWRGGYTSAAEPACGFWVNNGQLSTLNDQELSLTAGQILCQ